MAVVCFSWPLPLRSQQVPANASKVGAPEIVVSADRLGSSTSIDRKIYSVAHDLQSVSGSVADILHNLPSVEVDAQGAVSIRGDANVQILIDGKPAAATSAGNRGEYLQQLPANTVESIEVITNSSARFKPDGAAGLINIITKKNRKPGRSGSAQASIGSDGRFNLGLTQAYHSGPITVNGSFNLKRDTPFRPFGDVRTQLDPVTGHMIGSEQDGFVRSRRLSEIAIASVDYDIGKVDRLSGSVSYIRRDGSPQFEQRNRIVDETGTVLADFDRVGIGSEYAVDSEESARYRHSFAGKGHEFTLDLRQSESVDTAARRFTDTYRVPAGLVTGDEQLPHMHETERELTAEYTRPLSHGAKLVLGYDLQRNDDRYDNHGNIIDPVAPAITTDPALTSLFVYGQTVHAAYTTLEQPFGKKLTALFGLRYEAAFVDTDEVTTGLVNHSHYFRLYPTLHLDYALSEAETLRFSYSHRIVRPEPSDLNPFPLFQNPLNLRAGNPDLKPQETDSLEGSFQYAANGISVEITPYLRNSINVFSDFSRLISPTVLLTTRENLGKSLATGSELIASGKLGKMVSFNVSGDVFYTRIDAGNLGIAGARSLTSYSAKGSLDYRVTATDLVQASLNYSGRRLTPQGYRRPSIGANFGYRHQFKNGLAAVATITDAFDSLRDRTVLNIGNLHDVSLRRRQMRGGNLALSWTFGSGKKPANTKFDYSE